MTDDLLRSSAQQVRDEMSEMYKRMTDPEERKKQRIKERRKKVVQSVARNAGL